MYTTLAFLALLGAPYIYIYIYIYDISSLRVKYSFLGRSNGEENVQLDAYPVAGVSLYEATHCIARIVKAEM